MTHQCGVDPEKFDHHQRQDEKPIYNCLYLQAQALVPELPERKTTVDTTAVWPAEQVAHILPSAAVPVGNKSAPPPSVEVVVNTMAERRIDFH